MTLNDLERHNSHILCFFSPHSIALMANYVTVVEDRCIMSVNIVSQFQSYTFGHNYNPPCSAVSTIAELLVLMRFHSLGGDSVIVQYCFVNG